MLTQTKTLWILASVAALAIAGQNWISTSSIGTTVQSVSTISIASPERAKLYHTPADILNHPPYPRNLAKVKMMIGYPPIAKDAGIEGKVVLRILVDEQGRYIKHSVMESFHPMLRIPCEIYAPLIEFTPANKKGKRMKGWVQIPFTFQLTQPSS